MSNKPIKMNKLRQRTLYLHRQKIKNAVYPRSGKGMLPVYVSLTTNEDHLASQHRFLTEWTPEKFIEQAEAIHEDVAFYISTLLDHKSLSLAGL